MPSGLRTHRVRPPVHSKVHLTKHAYTVCCRSCSRGCTSTNAHIVCVHSCTRRCTSIFGKPCAFTCSLGGEVSYESQTLFSNRARECTLKHLHSSVRTVLHSKAQSNMSNRVYRYRQLGARRCTQPCAEPCDFLMKSEVHSIMHSEMCFLLCVRKVHPIMPTMCFHSSPPRSSDPFQILCVPLVHSEVHSSKHRNRVLSLVQ